MSERQDLNERLFSGTVLGAVNGQIEREAVHLVVAESGMAAFGMGAVENCYWLRPDAADRARRIVMVQTGSETANSGHLTPDA